MFRERVDLDELPGMKPSAYRLVSGHERPRDRASAKSRCQPEDLELIPQDVVQPCRVRFGLRWD